MCFCLWKRVKETAVKFSLTATLGFKLFFLVSTYSIRGEGKKFQKRGTYVANESFSRKMLRL